MRVDGAGGDAGGDNLGFGALFRSDRFEENVGEAVPPSSAVGCALAASPAVCKDVEERGGQTAKNELMLERREKGKRGAFKDANANANAPRGLRVSPCPQWSSSSAAVVVMTNQAEQRG